MAITNHERVGKAMDLLKAGLAPFVEREFTSTYKDRAAGRGRRAPGRRPPDCEEADRRVGRGGAAQADVGIVERRLPQDPRPAERSLVSELRDHRNKWAHQETFSSDDAYRALDSAGAAADRRLGAAGRRDREDEDGAAAAALRRAGAQREAQERRHRDRERGDGQAQALARGGHAAHGRGQRPLPAGRVRRRSLAGAPRRGDRRVPEPRRVLPPHLSHREPEGAAGRRGAAPRRQGRRPGGAAPDQLRRRQDPLDAGALPPVLRASRRASWRASTR